MAGKVLKVASNDLYGQVDSRQVVVFAAFCHTKYKENYVLFSFLGEYDKKKLCYGSIHLKDNSMVIFSVRDSVKKYIDSFIEQYMSDKIDDFSILDIGKIEKVELVSYSQMDYDKLQELEDKSIVKAVPKNTEEGKKKKPIFLYILLLLLVLFAVFLTILYLNPAIFSVKYKELVCDGRMYDQSMKLYYDISKDVRFDHKNKVESISVVRNYTFLNSEDYYDFKDNNQQFAYFSNGESYKYVDDGLLLKIFYKEDSVIDDYDEMLTFLSREGLSCTEKEYEK